MKDTRTPVEKEKKTPPEEDGPDDELEADNKKKTATKEQTTKRETETQQSSESKPDIAEEKKDDKGDAADNNDDDDDDEPNIHIDEETFRAWQNAYEAAERGAMEEQARSSMECCTLTIKIMLLCLVVAKVEKNFDNDDPDNVGFNTFWIIFPFLLFFGCVFCCCSCVIYGAAPGDAADLYEVSEHDAENPQATSDNDNNVLIPEPPSVDESNLGASVTEASITGESASGIFPGISSAETSNTTEASAAAASGSTASGSIFSGLSSAEESAANETQESSNPKILDTMASSMEDLD
jgi:hypothetical protein